MPTTTPSLSLPPPQIFDILPPLHALLSRLLLPHDPTDPTSPSPSSEVPTPLSPKELGPAASAITNKIQKARVVVRELPGVEMSIQEQEEVIEELEEEVRRLEGAIEGVRGEARERLEAAKGDTGDDGDGEDGGDEPMDVS